MTCTRCAPAPVVPLCAVFRCIYLTLLAHTVLVMLNIRIFALYEVLRCYDGFKSRLCMNFIFSLLVETCPAVTRCFPFFSSYGFLGCDVSVYGLYYLENPTFGFLMMFPNDVLHLGFC